MESPSIKSKCTYVSIYYDNSLALMFEFSPYELWCLVRIVRSEVWISIDPGLCEGPIDSINSSRHSKPMVTELMRNGLMGWMSLFPHTIHETNGISTYIYGWFVWVNVGRYTIPSHGCYGWYVQKIPLQMREKHHQPSRQNWHPRHTPVMASVTGCSTCKRGFNSRK